MTEFKSNPIVNIVRAEIVTNEDSPRVLWFENIGSAKPDPFVSEGDEKELRIKNRILAQDRLEDIIKGYNIKLKDCVLSRDLLEVVDGGEYRAAGSARFEGYTSPLAGVESARTRFSLRLYAAEKDYSGESVSFFRFSFPHCAGSPAKFSFEDGVFSTPEYTVKSRPGSGEAAMLIEMLDSVPVYVSAAPQAPGENEEGKIFMPTTDITLGGVTFHAGDTVVCTGSGYQVM